MHSARRRGPGRAASPSPEWLVAARLPETSRVRPHRRPLDRLNTAIDAFAAGDLEHAIDLPRTNREIEHVASTFDAMRDTLVARDRQLKAKNEELQRSRRGETGRRLRHPARLERGRWIHRRGAAAALRKSACLRNDNTKSKRGSGLGLDLCMQIAAQHGGTIDASSETGAWARFTLRLPARD